MCLIDAIIDQIRRWIEHYRVPPTHDRQYVGEDRESTDSNDHDYVEDLYVDTDTEKHTEKELVSPRCFKHCEGCGQLRHISLVKCRNCGLIIRRKTVDWNVVKRRAPKSSTYTSKRLFQRIHQLHAAHKRDVVILIFNHGAVRKKGRCYGTPGAADAFLTSKMGKKLKKTWRCYMLEGQFPIISTSGRLKSKQRLNQINKK